VSRVEDFFERVKNDNEGGVNKREFWGYL